MGRRWYKTFYIFNVLPFGICVAVYIFTTVLSEFIKHWRSIDYRIVRFLDDGMGGDVSFEKSSVLSDLI
jgi:hypothetical protein